MATIKHNHRGFDYEATFTADEWKIIEDALHYRATDVDRNADEWQDQAERHEDTNNPEKAQQCRDRAQRRHEHADKLRALAFRL